MRPSQTSILDSNIIDIRNDLKINFDHIISQEDKFSKQIWFKEIGYNFKRPCVLWNSILYIPSICFLYYNVSVPLRSSLTEMYFMNFTPHFVRVPPK